ncbi:MAG: hypothetical protein COA86_02470 [Kangiella sp.]|nr:MAG: hypothetical protein COA86_02470 [Kangiella sp.]
MSNKKTNESLVVRALSYVINKIWLLFAFCIIGLATLFLLLELLLPEVNRYKPEIVNWIESNYEIDIEVDSISAKWSSSGPSLSLINFSLFSDDKTFNIFEVGSLSIEFDLLSSILNREYSTHAILLQSANIRFYIDRKLGVKLNTFSTLKEKPDISYVDDGQIEDASKRFFDLLVAQKKIEIVNSKLQLMTLDGSIFDYEIENLTVKRYEDNHQLVGHLEHITESTTHSNSIELIAEVFHGVEETANHTNLYLNIDEIDLASLPKIGYVFDKNKLSKAEPNSNSESLNDGGIQDLSKAKTVATLKMWARWQNRHWQTMDAQIVLSGSEDLSAILSWRNEDYHHGYAVLHDLIIGSQHEEVQNHSTNEEAVSKNTPESNKVFIKYLHEEKENISWDILIKNFDVSSLLNYMPSVLSEDIGGMAWLKESDAILQIDHFKINFTKNKSKWASSPLSLKFSNFKIKSRNNIPTFSVLKGWTLFDFEKQLLQSGIESDSSDLVIDELFRELIPVGNFNANIASDLSEGFSELYISDLTFINSDLDIRADAKFYFDNSQPNLSLKVDILKGNVSQTFRYLPTGIMSDSLVDYLDSSIKTGMLFDTTAILRGPLKEFPYPNYSGVFAVLAKVENATYRYLPEWPLANKANAHLLFEGSGMSINVDSAESLGNLLTSSSIRIADMSSENSILEFNLNIASLNNQARTFLEESPLDFISNGLDDLDFSGEMKTAIELNVPLSDDPVSNDSATNKGKQKPHSKISLLGSVEPVGNNLTLNLPFVQVKSVRGILAFNEEGIIKSEMSGKVNNKNVQANIQSVDKYNDANKEHTFMELELEGAFSSSTVDQFIDGGWSGFLSGEADFTGKIFFIDNVLSDSTISSTGKDEKESKMKVNFSSDLNGFSFSMPDFLSKKKDVNTPFQLDLIFVKSKANNSQQGKIKWSGLKAEWLTKQDDEYSVFVDVSDSQSKKPDQIEPLNVLSHVQSNWTYPSGLTMHGDLEIINLKEWITFIDQIGINYATDLEPNEKEQDGVEWLVNKVDLSVNRILIPGLKEISAVELTADKYLDLPWRLSLNSQQGNVDILFDDKSPWLVNAENIDIQFEDESSQDEIQDEIRDDLEIEKQAKEQMIRHFSIYSSLPEMDINCILCQFNEKNVGNFRASVRKSEEGDESISLKAKIEKGKEHQVSLSALWSMNLSDKNDGEIIESANYQNNSYEKTNVDLTLSTNNVGTMLKRWGFQPSIEDSKGKVIGNLSWNNSPWQVDYKKISGSGRLDFGKGYLSQISDGDGRILTLFNLKSILRKLTFDFKDVYKKGFFYESMGGSVNIDNGVISTYDTSIKGNVADVWLYGTTDLNNETVEQHAIVSPHITSSVPVLAAWALEPTTGIILYLLGVIMEPAIDVATQIDYRVHGSFEKTIVDEIKKSKKRVKINLDDKTINENQHKEQHKEQSNDEARVQDKDETKVRSKTNNEDDEKNND